MAQYYFLLSALPPLKFGQKPDMSFLDVKEMLAMNLTAKDAKLVEKLLLSIDFYNIRALWLGLPLDPRGNIPRKELEERLHFQEALPEYAIDFLRRYESTSDRLHYFSSMYASLYREETTKGFLLTYHKLEREMRLILTALRAKRAGKDIAKELQFEDPHDPLVADILAQKDAADYSPPREYEDLKNFFMDNSAEPEKLENAVAYYRFQKIEAMQSSPFGIDQVLAYLARFLIVESIALRDREQGKMVVEQLSQYG